MHQDHSGPVLLHPAKSDVDVPDSNFNSAPVLRGAPHQKGASTSSFIHGPNIHISIENQTFQIAFKVIRAADKNTDLLNQQFIKTYLDFLVQQPKFCSITFASTICGCLLLPFQTNKTAEISDNVEPPNCRM